MSSSIFHTLGISISQAAGSIKIADVIDILIVALLIYFVMVFVKRTRSFFIVNSIIALVVLSYLSRHFNLGLTREILQPLFTFFVIIIVVIYQREIRNLFDWFSLSSRNLSFLRKISISTQASSILVTALETMAADKTGAIIVFEGEYPLEDIIEGGFPLEGKISIPLLLSVFDHHTPGHDGAVLIKNHLITGFGYHLPLAQNYSKYAQFGTRHRAATGITEHTDALAVVVSEEKGTISIAERGEIRTIKDREELESIIKTFLKENIVETQPHLWRSFLLDDLWIKIVSIAAAIILWFFFVFQTGYVTRTFSVPIEFRYIPSGDYIASVSQGNASLGLVGRTSDFSNYDSTDLKVVIDLTNSSTGPQSIALTKDSISYPSYFSLVSINPEKITLDLEAEKLQVEESSSTVQANVSR